ncbi:MAG: hypothetical protein JXP73_12835 [Deltaproteobacteria bacterium]|nr:hypothetical protein [Deltaproteobacteria bacterium]
MTRKTLFAVVLACACSSESPADVTGTYTLSLTVKETGCGILNGAVNDSSTGVEIVVTQASSDVNAQVKGIAGIALALAMGSDTFTGQVAGHDLDLWIEGTMPGSTGTCAYTRNAHLAATLTGDVLQGSVTYTYATNRTADCGSLDTCQDIQLLNGVRPPTVGP